MSNNDDRTIREGDRLNICGVAGGMVLDDGKLGVQIGDDYVFVRPADIVAHERPRTVLVLSGDPPMSRLDP